MSKYHATFCPGSDSLAYKSLNRFPRPAPTDDAEKSIVSHMVLTCSNNTYVTK